MPLTKISPVVVGFNCTLWRPSCLLLHRDRAASPEQAREAGIAIPVTKEPHNDKAHLPHLEVWYH